MSYALNNGGLYKHKSQQDLLAFVFFMDASITLINGSELR